MKKLIVFVFAFLVLASLVSATELKLTKVSDLKTGDIIVSKAGEEIPVDSLIPIKSDTLTISEYIRQKVFGENAKENIKISTDKVVGSGTSGKGVMNGNAVVNLPSQESAKVGFWTKIKNTVRGWFGK